MEKHNTVLIIDDSSFIPRVLKKIFENNEYEVVGYAENGYKGLEMYQQLKPDLVTLDITMPDIDGVETLRMLRKIDPDAKVIMLSATDYSDIKSELVELGIQYFILKPFGEKEVINAANALLNRL